MLIFSYYSIGVGNLGSALLNYKGFEEEDLKFVAAFDKEKSKVGKVCGNIIVEYYLYKKIEGG